MLLVDVSHTFSFLLSQIHKEYASPNPPCVKYIRKREFFGNVLHINHGYFFLMKSTTQDATLSELFAPPKVLPNYKEKYMWLLAFAATAPENGKVLLRV
jgi:hypothetical protein